jgi:predicted dehydrogenase
MTPINIGFMGAGGIARAHAFALNSLKYYYDDAPEIVFRSVTSQREESRSRFAGKYGFRDHLDMQAFQQNEAIDTVLILGPNNVHFEHMEIALKMPGVKRIYLEKPVCASLEEEEKMKSLVSDKDTEVSIQVGFQFLQAAAIREMLIFWKSGAFGSPIHFDMKYYHGDYLRPKYRNKRKSRLTPAPDGGAMADLGSHAISMVMAFFGDELQIKQALQAGSFEDVPEGSDLFSTLALYDPASKAVGHLSASRVSAGTGDLFSLEIYAENGALRYSTSQPDSFEYYFEATGQWNRRNVNSNYVSITSFPSGYLPTGWLRSMIHAHYVFLTGNDHQTFIPDLKHGLAVQRVVREAAEQMNLFRKNAT